MIEPQLKTLRLARTKADNPADVNSLRVSYLASFNGQAPRTAFSLGEDAAPPEGIACKFRVSTRG